MAVDDRPIPEDETMYMLYMLVPAVIAVDGSSVLSSVPKDQVHTVPLFFVL